MQNYDFLHVKTAMLCRAMEVYRGLNTDKNVDGWVDRLDYFQHAAPSVVLKDNEVYQGPPAMYRWTGEKESEGCGV